MLIAAQPQTLTQESVAASLYHSYTTPPQPAAHLTEALSEGPPLLTTQPNVPEGQILIDTPDFDTGRADRYINRQTARSVLEASHLFIYAVTNATYNNLENTRFVRQMLTEAGMRATSGAREYSVAPVSRSTT